MERKELQKLCKENKEKLPDGFKCNASNDLLRTALQEIGELKTSTKTSTKSTKKIKRTSQISIPDMSIWTLQSEGKTGGTPNIKKTIFLPKNADILDATAVLAADIKQEHYDRASVEGAKMIDKLKTPKQILRFLNNNNERSLSYYVVKIYPSDEIGSSTTIQEDFAEKRENFWEKNTYRGF